MWEQRKYQGISMNDRKQEWCTRYGGEDKNTDFVVSQLIWSHKSYMHNYAWFFLEQYVYI